MVLVYISLHIYNVLKLRLNSMQLRANHSDDYITSTGFSFESSSWSMVAPDVWMIGCSGRLLVRLEKLASLSP